MDDGWISGSWQLFHKINNNEATQKTLREHRDGLIWSFIKFIIIASTDYCTVYLGAIHKRRLLKGGGGHEIEKMGRRRLWMAP